MTAPAPLHLVLAPLEDPERPLARRLQILVAGVVAWPLEGEEDIQLEVQADDLLSHLTEYWKPLLLRQVYPVVETVARPSDLLRLVQDRWEELPEPLADEEADLVNRFEQAHNLANAFGGLFDLPPAWIVRDGSEMACEFGTRVYRLPFDAVRAELERAGNALAEVLEAAGERWSGLVSAWKDRDKGEAVTLLAWSAGLDRSVARELLSEGKLSAPRSVDEAANDNDPLRIAARLAGALPPDQIGAIIDLARSFAGHPTPTLDRLTCACRERLDELSPKSKPFEQGEAAATETRRWLELPALKMVDIKVLAESLEIEVRLGQEAPVALEGLAIAGSDYGPGAYVNVAAERVRRFEQKLAENSAVRITLAHELCHLLLDRGHAMSAVEILQSRMSRSMEARARAFAAELLLPASTAAYLWDLAGSPLDEKGLQAVLRDLAVDFGVSISVAAWKLEHGAWQAPPQLRSMLNFLAPRR